LHGDFAVRYFGFCDAPPIDGTLEDYESFLIEPQYVGVHTLSDVALQQALDAVDEIVDPVPDRLEILYIQSFIPGGIALPGRQRVEELERLRATRETTWGEWFNPPLHIRVMLSIRRSREFNCGGAIRCTTRIDSIPEPIGLDWLSRAAPWMVAAPSTSDEGMDLPPVLFPRLKRFWPSIRSKTVDEARAYLEGLEHQRVEQEITLLGLRFTRLLAIRALPLVILLVLGYFCVHLRHIRHLLAKSGEGSADDLVASFPWVGLFSGWVSGVWTFLSIAVLPVLAIILLIRSEDLVGDLTIGAAIGSAVLCGGLGLWACVQIWRLRHSKDDDGSRWMERVKGLLRKMKPGTR
jgi:hypothetical protein